MEIDYSNNESILDFFKACNEFVEGKFILADIKTAKILRSISQSSEIYELVAECMINYDFEKELAKTKLKDSLDEKPFQLPLENHKIIPLVFCLLVELDSKKINFNDFIKSNFEFANNQKEEYDAFSQNIIIPFRNSIAEVFDIKIKDVIIKKDDDKKDDDKNENEEEKVDKTLDFENIVEKEQKNLNEELYENEDETKIFREKIEGEVPMKESNLLNDELLFDRMIRLTRILDDKLAYIRNPLKKSNLSLIFDALFEACNLKNLKIIVALVMSLNSIAGKERSMRNEIRELNTICYDFYE